MLRAEPPRNTGANSRANLSYSPPICKRHHIRLWRAPLFWHAKREITNFVRGRTKGLMISMRLPRDSKPHGCEQRLAKVTYAIIARMANDYGKLRERHGSNRVS